ncbi:MAG: hypothetical protein OXL34_06730 [Gemmatimonadota bacterium]|nr:hypothetical protein [Gemmatimonadota bacterium]
MPNTHQEAEMTTAGRFTLGTSLGILAMCLLLIAGCGNCAAEERFDGQAAGQGAIHVDQRVPILSIGTADGAEWETFSRIAGAVRLSTGTVVVAERNTSELRYFDARGAHLKSVGGRGEGPEEFGFLYGMWKQAGDSLGAYDGAYQRLAIYGPAGEFVRSIPIETAVSLGRPTVLSQFADGTWLVANAPSGRLPFDGGLIEGSVWTVARYSRDGRLLNTITGVRESTRWAHGLAGIPATPYLPFSVGIGVIAADAEYVYVGDGTAPTIARWGSSGDDSLAMQWDAPHRVVSSRDMQRYRDERSTPSRDDNPEAWRQYLREVPFPDSMPVYTRALVDALGCVWIRRFDPWGEGVSVWDVLSREGVGMGEVRLVNLEVLEIGGDYILGVERDDLDVPSVVLFPVVREVP